MTIGDQIQKLRIQKNLTQEQLAEMLEVSRQSVSKWELLHRRRSKSKNDGNLSISCPMEKVI